MLRRGVYVCVARRRLSTHGRCYNRRNPTRLVKYVCQMYGSGGEGKAEKLGDGLPVPAAAASRAMK